ncbi:amidase [Mangrovicoccus algicola]|uniref:Amidase n=1 Tax=Mangrovicoccus algicola TaxID=2771008 RepID=A0A8J6YU28_9RHOB|nr:amidase [Mangrovicoccus algicola]MBE3637802.1 amidase [Mangrovicoccus algicola]
MTDKTQLTWPEQLRRDDRELKALTCMAQNLPATRPGVTLGVKDIIDVAGLPTECGSPIHAGQVAARSADCVTLLERAGAVVAGKTVTTEFATTRPGPTCNPLNPAHTPGGSSSGSVAGVAAGLFDWALGTQTAGSVIRPAAYCGIAGFLPSPGVIPRRGVRIMSPTLDRVGVFARDMQGIAAMLEAFPGWSPAAMPDKAPRIAMLPRGVWEDSADEATCRTVLGTADALRDAGAEMTELDDPAPFLEMMEAQKAVMGYEIPRALHRELAEHRDLLSEELRDYCDAALAIPHESYAAALKTADRFRLWIGGVLEGHDAILGPSAAQLAPEGLGWTGDPFVNRIWSLAKLPAVSLPGAAARNGLKAAVQLTTGIGRDGLLCALATRFAPLVAGIAPE